MVDNDVARHLRATRLRDETEASVFSYLCADLEKKRELALLYSITYSCQKCNANAPWDFVGAEILGRKAISMV
jgi:hypothetical protein